MSFDCCLLGPNDIEVLFLPRVTSRVTAKVVTNLLLIFMWNVECIKCMQELLKVDGNTSKLVTCPTSICCVAHIRIGNLQYLPYNKIVLIHCLKYSFCTITSGNGAALTNLEMLFQESSVQEHAGLATPSPLGQLHESIPKLLFRSPL